MATNQCMTCERNFSTSTATIALKTHLQTHGYLLNKTSQVFFHENGDHGNSRVKSLDPLQRNIEAMLITWIIGSKMDFSFVENVNFLKMIHALYPCAIFPSKNIDRSRSLARKEELRTQVNSMLHEYNSKVGITADAWSSRLFRGYVAVTNH